MIGQQKLLSTINSLVSNGFPRFTILVGEKGSGKKLVCNEIANKLNCPIVSMETGVDEVRTVIQNSYSNTEPVIYVFPDADKMSVNAKNALLKITEEPPQKAYFILTITDMSNTLPTLISRGCVLRMNDYDEHELKEYLSSKFDISKLSEEEINFITETTLTPAQVNTLMSYNVKEFKDFVQQVSLNIHKVSSANCFKILNKLALKKDEDKWDVVLFLQALRTAYLNLYVNTFEVEYFQSVNCVAQAEYEITYKNSANKQYCLDQMILAIRGVWR